MSHLASARVAIETIVEQLPDPSAPLDDPEARRAEVRGLLDFLKSLAPNDETTRAVVEKQIDAARAVGMSRFTTFRRITLPLIRQPLMVAIIFRLLDSLRVFDLIYVLTANGSTTISMSGFVRREMVEYGNMGFGSAASTSLFLIIMLTAIIFLRLARVKLAEDAK